MLRTLTTLPQQALALAPIRLALATLIAFVGLSLTQPAEASAQSVNVEVRVITGSSGGGGVDSALSNLSGRLSRQFSQFNTFSQTGMRRFSLSVGGSERVSLPGGGSATIQLVSVTGGEQEIRISIPGGGSTIRTRGGIFFVGGAQVAGGTLILAIST